MSSDDEPQYLAPADQPATVREIAARMFPAYQLDGGTSHLAGCSLEDRYFLRLRFRSGQVSSEVFVDSAADPVDQPTIDALGMAKTATVQGVPNLSEAEIERIKRQALEQLATERETVEPCDAEVIACKYTEGKIRFTFGESVTDLPFSGWTRTLKAPPYVCPHSCEETFHLAATDDGRIAAADQIEACEETGSRVLRSDLTTCSVTGRRVLADRTVECPVCRDPLLPANLVTCSMCREEVSPACVRHGRCQACRTTEPVANEDPRLAKLLARYPEAASAGPWRISETATSSIFSASRWTRRSVVVVARDSFALRWAATGSRLSGRWTPWSPAETE